MLTIYNRSLNPVAILENAYNIGYERSFNEVWAASFSLPLNDPKVSECQPFNYVNIEDNGKHIGKFRIMPSQTVKNESTNEITYHCEHVISTLLDDVFFQYHQTTNLTTRDNIEFVLEKQSVKHWRLGTVDFVRYFHYKWENDNLLSALFSIPKPFDKPYQWTYDTETYPWTLNLVAPSDDIKGEIRYRKNLRGIEREENPEDLVTRIYPLGYGEGVNQLTIKGVNPTGLPYIDSDTISTYGVRSYVWIDRRFEDPTSLYENAKALLEQWKTLKVTYRVDTIDLTSIGGLDELREGNIVRVVDEDLGTFEVRVMKDAKPDIKGQPDNLRLEIANKTSDIATTQLDMQRKIQINEAYAQGSTNIDSHDYTDNCDAEHPAVIRFFIPEELVRINKMTLSYESLPFRAYSKATKGGGATTATSTSGGGTTATSSSGGGVSTSTASGGGTSTSSASGGNHYHVMFNPVGEVPGSTTKKEFRGRTVSGGSANVNLEAPFVDIHTYGASGDHTHTFSVPSHTHTFDVPNHSHSVTIPNHSHDLALPDHIHDILYGIFEGDTPAAVTVKVDGNVIPSLGTNENDVDIIPYLSKDSEGKINRGTWHEVEILPNSLGRITANIATQLFLQSRGGGDY